MNSRDCIVLPVLPRDVLEFTGADAARFLHNYCSSDIKAIGDCETVETFFPNEKGRILAFAFIERDGDRYFVSGSPGTAAALEPHLGKYALFDKVEIANRSDEEKSFLVYGVEAAATIDEAIGTALAENGHSSACRRIHSVCETIHESFRVFGASSEIDAMRNAVVSAGAVEGDDELAEFKRIEAGVPVVGVDVTDKNLVQEAARTGFAVSFTKGCYLGQEPIARLDAMGHTNKQLRTIRFAEPVAVGGEVLCDDKPAGVISSVATQNGQTVALAVLRTAAGDAGCRVCVNGIEGVVQAPLAVSATS